VESAKTTSPSFFAANLAAATRFKRHASFSFSQNSPMTPIAAPKFSVLRET
jgi:hypothetical protein